MADIELSWRGWDWIPCRQPCLVPSPETVQRRVCGGIWSCSV